MLPLTWYLPVIYVFRIMKVTLSEQCLSLAGMLERGLGYHLQRRKNGFFAKRNTKGFVPPDGHWRFIVLCAEMAQNKLYITDIKVDWAELTIALRKAHHFVASDAVFCNGQKHTKILYDAADILSIASECHSDIKKGSGL